MSQTDAAPEGAPNPQVDPRLLEVLVCPVTHSTLEYDRERNELVSRSAGLAYPIRKGLPVMLPEEARSLDTTPGALPPPVEA